MDFDHLGFSCPFCGVDLVVPASAAGVEGPCPRCSSTIRAPRLSKKPEEAPIRLEVREEVVVKPRPMPNLLPVAEQPLIESSVMLADRKAGKKRNLLLASILVAFGVVLAIAFAGRSTPSLPVPVPDKVAPEKALQPTAKKPEPPPPAPSPAVPEINPVLDPRVPPPDLDVRALVDRSARVLDTFLHAGNFEQRLPLLETNTPREELGKSLIAGDLRTTGVIEGLEVKFDKVEGANEILFSAEYIEPDGVMNRYLFLVRARGNQEPKIVVDPFLDAFGGRMAAFAAMPQSGERSFKIIISVFDFCNDEAIPGAQQKCTVNISAAPAAPYLAKAYFARVSPLREKLDRMKIRHGRATGAHVVLRWNTDSVPFLELVDVVTPDWND